MHLDLTLRARIHVFQSILQRKSVKGVHSLAPCIRSILVRCLGQKSVHFVIIVMQCHYDPLTLSQREFLAILFFVERGIPDSVTGLQFPGRRLTFPIVLDDPWSKEVLVKYMQTIRNKAVYLPSNVEYLARNNGLAGGSGEALRKLIESDWVCLYVSSLPGRW